VKKTGFHQVEFYAGRLPSEVFFYQPDAGSFVQTIKVVIFCLDKSAGKAECSN
jgi:hypothetical protein